MPRPNTPIIHPKLMCSLPADTIPTVITIQEADGTADSVGEVHTTYADVDGLTGLSGRKMPDTAPASPLQERRREISTVTVAIWRVWLPAAYPQITTKHRAIVDGQPFNIMTVGVDANATQTILVVELVT